MAGRAEIELSLRQARATALAAQGFARRRPNGRVDARHLRRLIADVGLLQLDSVNVLSRAHYLPAFSRLGPYPREALDRLAFHRDGKAGGRGAGGERELFEYWAHEASLLPVELQPLLRWRMARVDDLAWSSVARIGREQPQLVAWVLDQVRERGPLRASELGVPAAAEGTGGDVELVGGEDRARAPFLRRSGLRRRPGQLRAPLRPAGARPAAAEVLATPTPPEDEAQRRLIMVAAGASASPPSPTLATTSASPAPTRRPAWRSWSRPASCCRPRSRAGRSPPTCRRARVPAPQRRAARALLSPFDSLIWARERTERLFDFHYRIEIYTPAAKRRHGYYVLPFLLGDRLVARVDLKSDRRPGLLRPRRLRRARRRPRRRRPGARRRAPLDGWLARARQRRRGAPRRPGGGTPPSGSAAGRRLTAPLAA